MSDEVDFEALLQDSAAPYAMASQPAASFRARGYDYDHEVLVTLPPSYDVSPQRSYPVVWAMDGALLHMLVAGIVNVYGLGQRVPEMIVVSVGHSSEQGMAGFAKRGIDLYPPGSMFGDDALSERTVTASSVGRAVIAQAPHFKGNRFLDFLIDQLRPALAKQYRMSGDHALMGHRASSAARCSWQRT